MNDFDKIMYRVSMESVIDTLHNAFISLYKKFHEIFVKFKKWVKSIIARLRGIFQKDSIIRENDVSDVHNVLSEASKVDETLKDKSSSGFVSSHEYEELKRTSQSSINNMIQIEKKYDVIMHKNPNIRKDYIISIENEDYKSARRIMTEIVKSSKHNDKEFNLYDKYAMNSNGVYTYDDFDEDNVTYDPVKWSYDYLNHLFDLFVNTGFRRLLLHSRDVYKFLMKRG